MYDRTGLSTKCTLIKTGFKNARTGTKAKFRPFVGALVNGLAVLRHIRCSQDEENSGQQMSPLKGGSGCGLSTKQEVKVEPGTSPAGVHAGLINGGQRHPSRYYILLSSCQINCLLLGVIWAKETEPCKESDTVGWI